jgi:hypothetical protein
LKAEQEKSTRWRLPPDDRPPRLHGPRD